MWSLCPLLLLTAMVFQSLYIQHWWEPTCSADYVASQWLSMPARSNKETGPCKRKLLSLTWELSIFPLWFGCTPASPHSWTFGTGVENTASNCWQNFFLPPHSLDFSAFTFAIHRASQSCAFCCPRGCWCWSFACLVFVVVLGGRENAVPWFPDKQCSQRAEKQLCFQWLLDFQSSVQHIRARGTATELAIKSNALKMTPPPPPRLVQISCHGLMWSGTSHVWNCPLYFMQTVISVHPCNCFCCRWYC